MRSRWWGETIENSDRRSLKRIGNKIPVKSWVITIRLRTTELKSSFEAYANLKSNSQDFSARIHQDLSWNFASKDHFSLLNRSSKNFLHFLSSILSWFLCLPIHKRNYFKPEFIMNGYDSSFDCCITFFYSLYCGRVRNREFFCIF